MPDDEFDKKQSQPTREVRRQQEYNRDLGYFHQRLRGPYQESIERRLAVQRPREHQKVQRQKKRQQQMLRELKSGDVVITSGGIVGTITTVDSDTIVVRVKPDNLKLQFSRSAVSSVVPPESSK